MRTTRLAAAWAALLGLAPVAGAAVEYTITDLSTLGPGAVGTVLNEAGEIAGGFGLNPNAGHAFRTTGGGTVLHDLGVLNGRSSAVIDMNSSGEVSGVYTTMLGGSRAFRGNAAGVLTDMGTLGGGASSANGINDHGVIVGTASATFPEGDRAFRTDAAGAMVQLGTLGISSSAYAINNNGVIVGNYWVNGSEFLAFRTDAAGVMTGLGTLAGRTSWATDINESGQVIGWSSTHAFRTDAAGVMTDLDTFDSEVSRAYGMNDAGQVVGQFWSGDDFEHAFVYVDGYGMRDLNALIPADSGWTLRQAWDINNAGRILAIGYPVDDGPSRSLLLTPVPEPGTLLTLGAGGVALFHRRRTLAKSPRANE